MPTIVLPPGFSIRRLVRTGNPHTSLEAAQQAHKSSARAIYQVAKLMMDGVARIDEDIWVDCRTKGFRRTHSTILHARLALSDAGYLVYTNVDRPTFSGCGSREWVWYGASVPGLRQSSSIVDSRPILTRLIMENDHLRNLVSEAIKKIEGLEQCINELHASVEVLQKVQTASVASSNKERTLQEGRMPT